MPIMKSGVYRTHIELRAAVQSADAFARMAKERGRPDLAKQRLDAVKEHRELLAQFEAEHKGAAA